MGPFVVIMKLRIAIDGAPFPHRHSRQHTTSSPILLMDQNASQSDYLMLFRNNAWYEHLSPEEIQRVMTDWMAWFDGLVAEGRCLGGQSLEHCGQVVRGADRQVTDGPYAEAKESVAGYFILRVAGLDEATDIAKNCPGLPYGATVEIRKLMDRCDASRMAENGEMAGSL